MMIDDACSNELLNKWNEKEMRNIKKISLFTLFLLFVGVNIQAQQNRRGRINIEEMHQKKWEFMIKELNLSPVEVDAVKPVFLEFERKNWELHREMREFFMKSRSEKRSDKDFEQLNNRMINVEIKKTRYLREYHLKLSGMLNAETLFNYYRAQKAYERQLLQRGHQTNRESN